MCTEQQAPCATCPWRRDATPIGADAPRRLVHGLISIFVPCSHGAEYIEPNWRERSVAALPTPCAGVAVFRANTNRAQFMPAILNTHKAEHVDVFSTPAEFVAHHTDMSVDDAQGMIDARSIASMCAEEMASLSHIYRDKLAAAALSEHVECKSHTTLNGDNDANDNS